MGWSIFNNKSSYLHGVYVYVEHWPKHIHAHCDILFIFMNDISNYIKVMQYRVIDYHKAYDRVNVEEQFYVFAHSRG